MAVTHAQTLHELYRQQAAVLGDVCAVRGLNAADLSYRRFVEQVQKVVDALSGWGIGRGDRVLIQLPNGPEAFVIMHGVAASAVAVLIDSRAGAGEIEYYLSFTQPKALILQQGVDSDSRALAQQYGVRVIDVLPTPEAGAGSFVFADLPPTLTEPPILNGPDDLAFLIATSGTTAQPKLVPKSQRAMLKTVLFPLRTQFRALHETQPIQVLNYLPLHIIFGSMMTSAALASGGSVACMPGFDPEKFYQWLDVYRPNHLAGPPAILDQLLAMAPQHQDILARHNVRYISTGASALPEATKAELNRVFAAPIIQTYGMTEADIIAQLILPTGSTDAVTTIGRADDVDKTRIMAADGTFLPVGQVGEIVVKPDMFSGYWNNPEADKEAFVDGWFRTGDEGMMDANGHITILGRLKEVINSGGAKVSPYEVEAVLKQHPQVTDAAVFGIPHAEIGETVAAAVVGTVSERELRKFAAERLPFYKVPMRILIVDEIPKAVSGKVQRNRLAERLGLK